MPGDWDPQFTRLADFVAFLQSDAMMTRVLFAGLGCALMLPSAAFAQTYTMTSGAATFTDASAAGTPLTFASSDDAEALVTLPFDFVYFGATIPQGTQIGVQTNGTVNLAGSTTAYGNTGLPDPSAPNGIIAAYWTDLELGKGSVVVIENPQILIVQWTNVQRLKTADVITFQVALEAGTNLIQIAYGPRTGDPVAGAASVGIENGMGTVGSAMTCTPVCMFGDVAADFAVVFTPSAAPPAAIDLVVAATSALPSTAEEGSSVTIDYTVTNQGNQMSGASDVSLYAALTPPAAGGMLVANTAVPALAGGATASGALSFTVPNGSAGDTYFLALRVDGDDLVFETNESNNDAEFGSLLATGGGPRPLAIVSNVAPAAFVGTAYTHTFAATGGTPPYSWSVGMAGPPEGLTLATDGSLTGSPTTAGLVTFDIMVSDSAAAQVAAQVMLNVNEMGMPGPLAISVPPRVEFKLNTVVQFPLNATGGTPPYAWTLTAGALPAGLSIVNDAISGTATATTTQMVDVTVTDAAFQSLSKSVTVVVSVTGNVGNSPTAGARRTSTGCACTASPMHGTTGSAWFGLAVFALLIGRRWPTTRRRDTRSYRRRA